MRALPSVQCERMLDRAETTCRCYCFGPFRLDVSDHQLYKDGQPVELPRRLVRALELLVENHGRTLEKTYLMAQLWPNTMVEENNLTVTISMLRKVLGDDAESRKYIQTKPRRGYRFVAEVTEAAPPERDPGPQESDAQEMRPPTPLSRIPGASQDTSISPVRRYRVLPLIGLAGGLLLALALFCIYEWSQRNTRPSIAVLPFRSVGAEEDGGYVGLGMADGLISRLRNAHRITVRSTADVAKYQGASRDELALGRELHVASLLAGTVQRKDGQLWLRVRLLRVKDGAVLWSDEYHGAFADLLVLQDQIAERTTRTLALKSDRTEQQRRHRPYTGNSGAYQDYLAGRYYCQATGNDRWLEKGVSYFQQAIERDSRFALAYAGLAGCYVQLASSKDEISTVDLYSRAEQAAQHALETDRDLQEAYLPLAMAKVYGDWDYAGAESAFRKSIELAPESPEGHAEYAEFLSALGRSDEAVREAHRALDLDPYSWSASIVLNDVYFFGHRYEQATDGWEKAREVSLDVAGWYLAWLYASRASNNSPPWPTPIIRELLKAQEGASRKETYTAELAYAYALQGRHELARDYLEKLAQYPDSISPYQTGLIYAALDDKGKAFEFLALARDYHSGDIPGLKVDPRVDNLRSDPRFSELLRSVHLNP